LDGTTEGRLDGSPEGNTDGRLDGNKDGTTNGTPDGRLDGSIDGTPKVLPMAQWKALPTEPLWATWTEQPKAIMKECLMDHREDETQIEEYLMPTTIWKN
jgi:hypothetical protein